MVAGGMCQPLNSRLVPKLACYKEKSGSGFPEPLENLLRN